jgi:Cu-Zn family superoxide dismutase
MMRLPMVLAAFGLAACGRSVIVSSPTPPPGQAPALPAAIQVQATAAVIDLAGATIGNVSFADTPAGLLVIGSVSGLGIGAHGVHLHSVGRCEAPFASAGPHFNPGVAKHGFRNPAGHHAGDLPNVVTPPAGAYAFQFIVAGVKLTGKDGLMDADGASIVFHSGADDYVTDPSGGSGGRLACGVITLTK